MMAAIDVQVGKLGGRGDLGEMAQISGVESLTAVTGAEIPALFGSSRAPQEAKLALRGLATVGRFAVLARDFVARLTRRYLDYYLGRELASHVGAEKRFQTLREQQAFQEALDLHCREASRILDTFAGEWFSKTLYEGGVNRQNAGAFAYAAFDKMRKELRVRRGERA